MLSQPSPAYIHTLTTAFASTLDEIPQDMCRHFADLRELDAVLSQSLSGITKRVEELTQRIEGGLASLSTLSTMANGHTEDMRDTSSPDATPTTDEEVIAMFQLLHEIADDTGRIKLGGEDKIRVASLAAEHMNAYHSHLLTLVRRMCYLDSAYALEVLSPHTLYPHVPPSALVDPAPENRRGAPRRTVAVQNNSYGQQYAPMSAQGQNGAYHSSHRNESATRGLNGDTPNKRRRVQAPNASSSAHNHSQLQGPRNDRDMDTDDHSTPRRGVSALDAEAYRPGGNTANRARTNGRKGREGRAGGQNPMLLDSNGVPLPMDGTMLSRGGTELGPSRLSGNVSQGGEPSMPNQATTNGISSHKNQLQNGRSRGNSSQHHRTNLNPQPQQYPMHYPPYGGRSHLPGNPFVDPSAGPYEVQGGSYPPTANMNPMMEAAAYHHHAVNMNPNMNPNMNHLPPNASYPGAIGMGMVIPSSLPPPPGTGRPSPATIPSRNTYDVPPPRSAGNSRQNVTGGFDPVAGGASSMSGSHGNVNSKSSSARAADLPNNREGVQEKDYNPSGNGSSASGGLMPLPMLTSLPPAGVLTHPSHAPHPSYVDPALSRNRGYSATQGYSGSSYNAQDTNQALLPTPVSHHPHASYQPSQSSPLVSGHPSQQTYGGHPTGNVAASDKGVPKPDVHPSLLISLTKDPISSSVHARGPSHSASTSGPSSAIHGSLARDPHLWGESPGPAERFERDTKAAVPSRARSGTMDGVNGPTIAPVDPSKYQDEPPEQRKGFYEGTSPLTDQRDHDRENATAGIQSSQQTSAPTQTSGGLVASTYSSQSLPQGAGQGSQFASSQKVDVAEKLDTGERESVEAAGSVKLPAGISIEREGRSAEADNEMAGVKGDAEGSSSRDGQKKVFRTPTRRKTGEEDAFPSDSPTKSGGGTEIVEGQAADEDSKPYCICGRPSFGQMIGCDDSECEFEWFHLDCLGITGTPPQGDFVCPTCRARRSRGNRKGIKKKVVPGVNVWRRNQGQI